MVGRCRKWTEGIFLDDRQLRHQSRRYAGERIEAEVAVVCSRRRNTYPQTTVRFVSSDVAGQIREGGQKGRRCLQHGFEASGEGKKQCEAGVDACSDVAPGGLGGALVFLWGSGRAGAKNSMVVEPEICRANFTGRRRPQTLPQSTPPSKPTSSLAWASSSSSPPLSRSIPSRLQAQAEACGEFARTTQDAGVPSDPGSQRRQICAVQLAAKTKHSARNGAVSTRR